MHAFTWSNVSYYLRRGMLPNESANRHVSCFVCRCSVVSGSRDATLRVWDVDKGQCLHILVGHLAAVRCVQYDGRLVVSGAYDNSVKVWDPKTENCLHTLIGHTNRVYSLQVSKV
jgi:F-box/WD-40 domain protein 7